MEGVLEPDTSLASSLARVAATNPTPHPGKQSCTTAFIARNPTTISPTLTDLFGENCDPSSSVDQLHWLFAKTPQVWHHAKPGETALLLRCSRTVRFARNSRLFVRVRTPEADSGGEPLRRALFIRSSDAERLRRLRRTSPRWSPSPRRFERNFEPNFEACSAFEARHRMLRLLRLLLALLLAKLLELLFDHTVLAVPTIRQHCLSSRSSFSTAPREPRLDHPAFPFQASHLLSPSHWI